MEELTPDDIVRDYLNEFEGNMSVEDVVFKVVGDGVINKTSIRNRSIVNKYHGLRRETEKSIRTIYDDLAYMYNVSAGCIKWTIETWNKKQST